MSDAGRIPVSARLFVVDDDEGLLILMAETLRQEGYIVDTASSWSDAATRLQGQPHDLLLLDLKLRDAQGAELLERLAAAGLGIPFVVVTGQGDEKSAVEVMKHGALDYLMKDAALLDFLPAVVRRSLDAIAREKALTQAKAEHTRLEREIMVAAERERLMIGADLHDGLGQLLTALELMCTALKEDAKQDCPPVAIRLDQMGSLLRDAVSQTRYLARGLVPIREGADALSAGLAELANRADALGRARCRFESSGVVEFADSFAATHLYRIAQEAVNNAVKHSGAKTVVVRLVHTPGFLRLEIQDDGRGLPPEKIKSSGVGLGVMRHRAQSIGAALRFDIPPTGGLLVCCTLPVPTQPPLK